MPHMVASGRLQAERPACREQAQTLADDASDAQLGRTKVSSHETPAAADEGCAQNLRFVNIRLQLNALNARPIPRQRPRCAIRQACGRWPSVGAEPASDRRRARQHAGGIDRPEVRAFRSKLGITRRRSRAAAKLSAAACCSKIENGLTSPSLTTLKMLSAALGVPVTAFFRRYEERRDAVFVRAGEGLVIERRGTRAGHQYQLLGTYRRRHRPRRCVEPYLITLTRRRSTCSRSSTARRGKYWWSSGDPRR